MTVAALIDRTYREWLTPPNQQPARFQVNNAGVLAAAATSVITETSWLSPEEEDLIGPGTIIEIERELILVEAVTGTSPDLTLTIRRQMLGTTDVQHADSVEIILAPDYTRQSVFDALSDVIDDIWPTLWAVKIALIPTSTSWVEVDDDVEELFDARLLSGTRTLELDPGRMELLLDFPLASSLRAIQYNGVPTGKTVIIRYKAKAVRPTAETDTLADLNIDSSWQKILTVGIAASLLRGSDIDAATQEFITESLAREGFPAGAGESLSNSLLRFQDFLMQRRARAQNVRTLPTQVIERVL